MAESIDQFLAAGRTQIDAALEARLPPADTRPATVHEAMRYSVLAGGKRLRPILCLAAFEAVRGAEAGGEGGNADALTAALAIELLHTYTLIHDDLPCMDDDDLRRGKPTCHVVFGEANAVLAGDALLTMSFEWLASTSQAGALVSELARASGSQGVIGGQIEDLAAENTEFVKGQELSEADRAEMADQLDYIHRHKTAALLAASVRMGGICAGATEKQLAALGVFGNQMGLAFQIIDDVLDATASTEVLGKPAGSDDEQGKFTYVGLHGVDRSRERAEALVRESIDAVGSHGLRGVRLADIARFVIDRSF